MKKFLSFIIAIFMIASLAAGCGNKNDASTKTETQAQSDITEPIVYMSSSEMDFDENIAAVSGDYEISMDVLNVFIGAIAGYIQQYTGSEEGWEDIIVEEGKSAREVLIESAIEEARYQNILLKCAMEDGYYTSEADEAFYQEYILNSGGQESYEEFLNAYGFTDEAFRKYISSTGAYFSIGSEENAEAIYNSEYLTAKHVLILFEGRETEQDAYNEAMEVYNRAINGESFEKLIEELNEDPGQDAETGYTFGEGTMVDEFYQGTKALKIGEISQPVKTTYGYHVIKRYELPKKGTDSYNESISTITNAIASEYANSEKITSLVEKDTIYVNEDLIRTIDLSAYTTVESAE